MAYTPRRAGKRWLDGDCPRGVLAIFDNPRFADRYTIFYADVIAGPHGEPWISYLGTSETGNVSGHGEMEARQMRDYRYRYSHRATTWTSLPDAVKTMVRRDCESDA